MTGDHTVRKPGPGDLRRRLTPAATKERSSPASTFCEHAQNTNPETTTATDPTRHPAAVNPDAAAITQLCASGPGLACFGEWIFKADDPPRSSERGALADPLPDTPEPPR